ncbi:MAG: hypothetical protein Q8P56_03445 [Candidatus Uhrbacteria bacterium]|nr:hypothetical protein [Candidatus Uhrbacteria bacterium]
MDNQETPAEYKNKFQLIFVSMFWSDDPGYATWTEGRIEIRTWDDPDMRRMPRIHNTFGLPLYRAGIGFLSRQISSSTSSLSA